jgi:hypothetical protein
MLVQGEIAIEPEEVKNCPYAIPDHGCLPEEAKGNEALDVLRHMGRNGGTNGVSGNLFIPQAMPR